MVKREISFKGSHSHRGTCKCVSLLVPSSGIAGGGSGRRGGGVGESHEDIGLLALLLCLRNRMILIKRYWLIGQQHLFYISLVCPETRKLSLLRQSANTKWYIEYILV